MAEGQHLQLVGAPNASARRTARVGAGLLLSLVVGFPALAAALGGEGSFELSIARYLLTVAACVGIALALGALYDRFTNPNANAGAASPGVPTDKDHP